MMLERLFFRVIQQGFEELRANPHRLERFLQLLGLTMTEIRSIRAWFETSNPSVNQAYPRHGASRFPGVFIVLEGEDEEQKFLDDSGGFISEDEAVYIGQPELANVQIRTSLFRYHHHILVVADNPDKCLYLYHITRYILSKQRDELERHGVLHFVMTAADALPDPNYLPETFFIRRLSTKVLAQAQVYDEGASFAPISQVSVTPVITDVLLDVQTRLDGENVVPRNTSGRAFFDPQEE